MRLSWPQLHEAERRAFGMTMTVVGSAACGRLGSMSIDLRLRPLRSEDESAARAAHEELAADDFPFLLAWASSDPWEEWLERQRRWRRGEDLRVGHVPAAFLGAFLDGELVGRSSIRFTLTDFLLNVGGHVGYAVRPGFRRRGIATEILRQSLVVLRAEGADDVLVTCDEGNVASMRVIESCGGVLEDIRDPGGGELPKRRYWIA